MNKKVLIIVIAITCVSILFSVLTFIHFDRNVSYTVFYDANGGSSIKSQVVKKGGKAVRPVDPIKDDYDFVGWLLNGEEYDFNSVVSSDITLTSKWDKLVKYNVTFDTAGGSTVEPQIVYADEKVKIPKQPTKKNYKFIEWQLNGKKYDFDMFVDEDIVLTAKWELSLIKPIVASVGKWDYSRAFKNGSFYSCRYYIKLDNYKEYLFINDNGNYDYLIDSYDLIINGKYVQNYSFDQIEDTHEIWIDCYEKVEIIPSVKIKNSNDYIQGDKVVIDSKQDLTPVVELRIRNGRYYLDTFSSISDSDFPGGLEFYEKTANGYEYIGDDPNCSEGGFEVNVDPGDSKTYVARTYLEGSNHTRVYSNYTNEVEVTS